ncbi:MAG: TolC family protein [Bacteroidetes bacterium]|nr:MAG: TolC family protein [Bacteroidota bacterium]
MGATVRFPIFDGLQKNSKIRQEKLSLQKIRNEIKSFEQGALIEISAKRNSLVDALNSLEVQEQNLQLATDIYNISKIKYDQGVGSSLEIMDAETSLKDAQTNYFSAMYEAVISKIELDKSMGNSIY